MGHFPDRSQENDPERILQDQPRRESVHQGGETLGLHKEGKVIAIPRFIQVPTDQQEPHNVNSPLKTNETQFARMLK